MFSISRNSELPCPVWSSVIKIKEPAEAETFKLSKLGARRAKIVTKNLTGNLRDRGSIALNNLRIVGINGNLKRVALS